MTRNCNVVDAKYEKDFALNKNKRRKEKKKNT